LANYEFAAVFDAAQTDDAINAGIESIKSILASHNCEITYVEPWGRRKLAYEIKGKFEGYYIFFYFRAPTGNSPAAELDRFTRITDNLLRGMLVKVPKLKTEADVRREEAQRDAERKAREEAAAARARAEEAREAEASESESADSDSSEADATAEEAGDESASEDSDAEVDADFDGGVEKDEEAR